MVLVSAVCTWHDNMAFLLVPKTLKEEHQEMKKLVLDFERRQEEEEYKGQPLASCVDSTNQRATFCL